MVGNRHWMAPPRQFQPMFNEFQGPIQNTQSFKRMGAGFVSRWVQGGKGPPTPSGAELFKGAPGTGRWLALPKATGST